LDKKSEVLTLGYSTGSFEGDVPVCKEHWEQQFDTRELCAQWSADRQPASDMARSEGDTEVSAARRRGVRSRTRVQTYGSYGTSSTDYLSNSPLFNGSLWGGGAQTQRGRSRHRDGLPRNSRREVIGCPHLGVSPCMSAIMGAESSCSATVPHAGR